MSRLTKRDHEQLARALRARLDGALFDVAVSRHDVAVSRDGAEYELRLDRQGSWSLADGHLYLGLDPDSAPAEQQLRLFAGFVIEAANRGAVIRRAVDAQLEGSELVWVTLDSGSPATPSVTCDFGLSEGDPHSDWWPARTQMWPPSSHAGQQDSHDWSPTLQALAPEAHVEAARLRTIVAEHPRLRAVVEQQGLHLVVRGPDQGDRRGAVDVCTQDRRGGDIGVALVHQDTPQNAPRDAPLVSGVLDLLAERLAGRDGGDRQR